MEEKCNIFGTLCFIISRKVKTTEMQKKKIFCTVCGEGAVTDQICQKQFVKFHAGDFLMDDADQLKLIAIKVRHYLRTINIMLCGR